MFSIKPTLSKRKLRSPCILFLNPRPKEGTRGAFRIVFFWGRVLPTSEPQASWFWVRGLQNRCYFHKKYVSHSDPPKRFLETGLLKWPGETLHQRPHHANRDPEVPLQLAVSQCGLAYAVACRMMLVSLVHARQFQVSFSCCRNSWSPSLHILVGLVTPWKPNILCDLS